MNIRNDWLQFQTRRHFLRNSAVGIGSLAFADLLRADAPPTNPLAVKAPPLPAKAKHIIYLHMSGAPPQQELFDFKPKLKELHMKPCPDDFLKNARFAFIKGHPNLLGPSFKFAQHGKSGAWISELLPELSKHADELCFVKSMWTEQFNHAPAELFLFSGNARNGCPSMGSWILYGLGTENQNLPGFVVLISGGTDPTGGKALWSTGPLPSVYQGVQCRTIGDPVLYANNPPGMDREDRRRSLDALKTLNELELKEFGDPETRTRIEQYELAFRMQMSVPEVMELKKETKETLTLYGAEPGKASFANNCLLARRLVEKGVRFVQLFDWGWDIHGTNSGDDVATALPKKCQQTDKSIAALLTDLKRRGMLDSTLVVWGGEFGRTSMNEARGGSKLLGRDHHPHAFTIWMAGAGVKPGITFGATDELGYNIADGKMSVHDLQATILHLMGLDAWKLRYSYQGLQQRLIGPEGACSVRKELLS
ncbi:DUF1501 domain-containing protein [Telmatocola sphagniphila]|uniref:DUF1501 domain-containing protein n=1 Tax=Telmatocola sphagniphila TaxID=1123043 RepID=A0A8E6B5A0_9BACT|nr:DUF1501 domain-containing protein [Telmatocola sphagniphila]QVL31371.1 DUF1501 domain-containing protein [Telmatocola sphagniphila]